jgi:hypothetical protein
VHDGERETEAMDGDVECRFAVFLQLHCAVKVENCMRKKRNIENLRLRRIRQSGYVWLCCDSFCGC